MFPNDENEWDDSDGDGYGDNEDDAFPYDATQYEDDDGDGYEDNSGNDADAFPTDSSEWADTDGDGYGDNSKILPVCLWKYLLWLIPVVLMQTAIRMLTGDAFDNGAAMVHSDGDGYGDNSTGTNPDYCPMDSGTSTARSFTTQPP